MTDMAAYKLAHVKKAWCHKKALVPHKKKALVPQEEGTCATRRRHLCHKKNALVP